MIGALMQCKFLTFSKKHYLGFIFTSQKRDAINKKVTQDLDSAPYMRKTTGKKYGFGQ